MAKKGSKLAEEQISYRKKPMKIGEWPKEFRGCYSWENLKFAEVPLYNAALNW